MVKFSWWNFFTEDFNKRSLVPELTDTAKMKLHNEAKELYRLYFAPNAVDRIQFENDIIEEVKDSKC